jgi:hypothetical protein
MKTNTEHNRLKYNKFELINSQSSKFFKTIELYINFI